MSDFTLVVIGTLIVLTIMWASTGYFQYQRLVNDEVTLKSFLFRLMLDVALMSVTTGCISGMLVYAHAKNLNAEVVCQSK